MDKSTYVILEGEFRYAINQHGLDFENKEERAEAVRDFWKCFEQFNKSLENTEHNFLTLDYKRKNIKVEEGD